ncbi:hypothetical protein DFA_02309 [Cavenderia fasciculata]|uniref:Uncharacterized protein n=1 Tax=Cavenderia fasciculata TaxID=261658 RepID=F4PZ36_CACFS|nr:uncharacterized protein DFA_02309 [Cavenderia fasciculata]EGG19065.1 hypothetical protein DFA_02309 [Cavenderia fasciculata]|eukprot:XP_004366698.1 hypothetical protein DFA_02309 [Cavenderia fasciculata]
MSILKLSNLLLLNIISEIDDNVDIICLLLTCKKLYHHNSNSSIFLYQNSSRLKRSIQFKGIEPIDIDKGDISLKFIETVNQFNLLSFKDILENSISNQHVILVKEDDKEEEDYPLWIQDRIYYTNNRVDKSSSITTAWVEEYKPKSLDSNLLYKIPSIETLFIYHSRVDLGSISLLPNLQRLSVRGNTLNQLGPHSSLKSLTLDIYASYTARELALDQFVSLTELTLNGYSVSGIGPGVLPSSLTSLTLTLTGFPPRDTFIALTSLVYLEIHVEGDEQEEEEKLFIDLETLNNLKTFDYNENWYEKDCIIEISVPPSIVILYLWSENVQIAQQQCTTIMPVLEKLYLLESLLTGGKINLQLQCPSLKKLCIYDCQNTIPSNLIPPTLEKLSIHNNSSNDILDQFVYPPSLTHLSIIGDSCDQYAKSLSGSLVKLKSALTTSFLSSPSFTRHDQLKKLVWIYGYGGQGDDLDLSQSNLETIDLTYMQGFLTVSIPPSTKYLTIFLLQKHQPDIPIFSILDRITKPKEDQSQQQQEQWLPINTTHLTCEMSCSQAKWSFRLDEIINHTNIRYLSFSMANTTFLQFSIQRLDSDNTNVLVLERQSLLGGIITQKSKTNLQQQDVPIYLNFDNRAVNWSFNTLNAKIISNK